MHLHLSATTVLEVLYLILRICAKENLTNIGRANIFNLTKGLASESQAGPTQRPIAGHLCVDLHRSTNVVTTALLAEKLSVAFLFEHLA